MNCSAIVIVGLLIAMQGLTNLVSGCECIHNRNWQGNKVMRDPVKHRENGANSLIHFSTGRFGPAELLESLSPPSYFLKCVNLRLRLVVPKHLYFTFRIKKFSHRKIVLFYLHD